MSRRPVTIRAIAVSIALTWSAGAWSAGVWSTDAAAVEPILVAVSDSSFSRPHDLTLSPDGRLLYVADVGNDAVKVLHPDTLATLGVIGRGWLYIADEDNTQIKIFDENREPLAVIGSGRRGRGADRLNKPEGVEAVGDRVWVSDTYNHRILLYRLRGAP